VAYGLGNRCSILLSYGIARRVLCLQTGVAAKRLRSGEAPLGQGVTELDAGVAPIGPGRATFTRRSVLGGLAAFAGACSRPPDLARGEEGRIARVSDGDLLALDTGQRVRLVEIEAPAVGYRERAAEPWADEARALLEAVSLGRMARLYYGGLSRDRYDRALAHVIAADETGRDVWINGYMIRQGAARVRSYPDNSRRARQMLALEAEARAARRGLWSLDDYRIRAPDDLLGAPAYAIVEGRIARLGETAGDGVARLGAVGVALDAGVRMGAADPTLKLDVGARIRVRGRIDRREATPLIRLTHWAQVETPEA
jgi:micrococcal nuclease